MAEDRFDRSERKSHHLVLLAKNLTGWKNLSYLNSMAFLEGFYYNPRIDRKLLREHSEGLVALSACLGGAVSRAILGGGMDKAIEVAREYDDILGPRQLLPRDPGQRAARAGDGQRRHPGDRQADRHPHHRHQRLPLPRAQGCAGAAPWRSPDRPVWGPRRRRTALPVPVCRICSSRGRNKNGRPLRDGHRMQMSRYGHQTSWAFTLSTMLPKAAGSLTASSASTLRSISIAAFFMPAMNWL